MKRETNTPALMCTLAMAAAAFAPLGYLRTTEAYQHGFGINGVKSPLPELGSLGEYNGAGFFYTAFSIDAKEQMIVISWRNCIRPEIEPGSSSTRAGLSGNYRLNAQGLCRAHSETGL
jgi:hypothetical protein